MGASSQMLGFVSGRLLVPLLLGVDRTVYLVCGTGCPCGGAGVLFSVVLYTSVSRCSEGNASVAGSTYVKTRQMLQGFGPVRAQITTVQLSAVFVVAVFGIVFTEDRSHLCEC